MARRSKPGQRVGRPRGRSRKERTPEDAGASGEATRFANVSARTDILRESLTRFYQLDKEIQSVVEEHIKELREEKSDIVKRVREDLNMPAKVFRARYYSYRVEQDAIAADDQITQDALVELFTVCPVTGQASFAEALDSTLRVVGNGEAEPDQAEPQEPVSADEAYQRAREHLGGDSEEPGEAPAEG